MKYYTIIDSYGQIEDFDDYESMGEAMEICEEINRDDDGVTISEEGEVFFDGDRFSVNEVYREW